MTIADYYKQGLASLISFDTTDWFGDHFLMLDDNTADSPGSWSWCGETCTRHRVQITSDVAQSVYVTAYTWEKRSYPTECQKKNKVHSIYKENDTTVYTFKEGARQMNAIEFDEGETINFILEWDWARESVSPDWSVTAWGKLGEVTVTHEQGIESASLPYISKNGSTEES